MFPSSPIQCQTVGYHLTNSHLVQNRTGDDIAVWAFGEIGVMSSLYKVTQFSFEKNVVLVMFDKRKVILNFG